MKIETKLEDGEIVKIARDKYIFKLASYTNNPILKPQDIGLVWEEEGNLYTGAVFNGGAEVFQDKIILTPRCHKDYKKGKFFDKSLGIERAYMENYISEVWVLVSEDGIKFNSFHNVVIKGDGSEHKDFIYGIEDIRVIRHSDYYFLIGCGKVAPPFKGKNADRIAIYTTQDFRNIKYHGIIDAFDTRNAVIFDNKYMLIRFYPNIHLEIVEPEQLLNPVEHRKYWEQIYDRRGHNLLLKAGNYPHESEKIGAGPQAIKTDRGWLLIYHAVGEIGVDICKSYGLKDGIKRSYSVCAALLDLDDPHKVICRTNLPIYIPSMPYELYGNKEYPVDIPCVVFPVGAVVYEDKILIYCGAGDKYTILLSCSTDKLVNYLFEYCKIQT